MTKVRNADPVTRRKAVLALIAGTIVGALSIAAFERYPLRLEAWLFSEPEQTAHRIKLVLFLLAAAISVPLIGVAAYLWSIGGKVIGAQAFPPPGLRVMRNTPVSIGASAIWRGRLMKALAVFLVSGAVWLWVLIAQLAGVLTARGP